MVICIICHLKNVWGKGLLVPGCITILGSILLEDGICICGDVLVWIESDEAGRADICVNVVCHETFAKT